jgi:hypothetical protein
MPAHAEEACKMIACELWELWNFPNCTGAPEGKHMRTEAP